MTADEKAAQQLQAAPLGLNGDTVKKKKKEKVKGAPKERLQDKRRLQRSRSAPRRSVRIATPYRTPKPATH